MSSRMSLGWVFSSRLTPAGAMILETSVMNPVPVRIISAGAMVPLPPPLDASLYPFVVP